MGRIASRYTALAMFVVIAGCAPGSGAGPSPVPVTPVPSFTAAPPSLPANFPLGVWKVTITEQDLRDQGVLEPLLLRENAGTFTKTYGADGSWSFIQESNVPLRWPVYRGTYTINEANEIAEETEFPPEYAGEVLRYAWAREGAAIRLDILNAPDPMLTVITETYPWQPE